MAARTINNIKLGIFVIAGLLLLILALYMIGRDSNLFGKNFELKARFENVQGLTAGNNIRYAGIQVGTVKRVKILSDTLIEVTMLIDEKMKSYIHQTDVVSISTDGLMGNKLLNITPGRDGSPLVQSGDILVTKKMASTEEMMETLNRTNNNIALISEDIKRTMQRINNSSALWNTLEDPALPRYLKESLVNIRNAADKADEMATGLNAIVNDVKSGKGSLGAVLTDTAIAYNLNEAVMKIRAVGDNANHLVDQLATLTEGLKKDIDSGKGTVNALLRDSVLAMRLSSSLANIEEGTAAFSENMEALKHNFLLRGYFRKQEKLKKKEEAASKASARK